MAGNKMIESNPEVKRLAIYNNKLFHFLFSAVAMQIWVQKKKAKSAK
ncbi:MAG: hypothetical protein LBV33_07235 [Lachnospiraceae bacterium]|nr:hypothetical protein [Lachnospiraceae bacterium]